MLSVHLTDWWFFGDLYIIGHGMPYPWYDAMADIDMHLFCIWWSQSNFIRAWLAGWLASLYMVLIGFGYFIFIIGWLGIGQFLAAVYFYQHLTFMRLHQHASSALISLLLITCPSLIWPDLIRSDDISLLWSDLVFYMVFLLSFLLKSILVNIMIWWYNVCNVNFTVWIFGYGLWICAHSEANFVNDNFLVVFCKMDYEGHLLNVNKVFTIFFFGKKIPCKCWITRDFFLLSFFLIHCF